MTDGTDVPLPFAAALPAHAEVVEGLRREVSRSSQWRWLELCCSLASGRGDELSDVDAAIGYADSSPPDDLDRTGSQLVESVGPLVDYLVHTLPGWPDTTRRFAVEYASGIQLDLVLMPASRREGLPDGALALVDKDARLAEPWTPPVANPPSRSEAREWVMLGRWLLSDTAKHLRRGSLFEAVARLNEAREQALRLFAAARGIPYPAFGLVSLLDFAPYELPDRLERTYCLPDDRDAVVAAALATHQLLSVAAQQAGTTLGFDLSTPWDQVAADRLAAAAGD